MNKDKGEQESLKVIVKMQTTDEAGETLCNENVALATMIAQGLRLTYVEDISGEGDKVKTTLLLSDKQLQVTRQGAIVYDFVYADGLTHHTRYQTPYGILPVTLVTSQFDYIGKGLDFVSQTLERQISIRLALQSAISMGDTAPMRQTMKIEVRESVKKYV